MRSALALVSALIVLYSPSAPAANSSGPDYWVGFDDATESPSPDGWTRSIEMSVGDRGTPGHYEQLVTLTASLNGRPVCWVAREVRPAAAALNPLGFQVVYTNQPAIRPDARVPYVLTATVEPAGPKTPHEDHNAINDRTSVTVFFEPGSVPQCTQR